MIKINDGVISEIVLLSQRFLLLRLDFSLCVLSYAVLGAWYLMGGTAKMCWLYGALIAVMQLVIIVASTWSLDIQSAIRFAKAPTVARAGEALVKAAPNAGKDRLVTIHRLSRSGASGDDATGGDVAAKIVIAGMSFALPEYQFEFQKVTYHCSSGSGGDFVKRQYPIQQRLDQYLSHGGYGYGCGSGDKSSGGSNISEPEAEAELESARRIFGRNEFEIPLPSFAELYVEHLLAPFFMFQVICLILWSLDDYWYYSVMTLALLMFFEAMQCKQRLNSLQMLRNMRQPAYPIFVFRRKTWSIESTLNLLPGDLISITSQSTAASRPKLFLTAGANAAANEDGAAGRLRKKKKFEPLVPCDVLLLHGTCICNEAMLTGESIPQTKEPISASGGKTARAAVMDIRDEEGSSSALDAAAAAAQQQRNEKGDTDDAAAAVPPTVEWKRHIVYGGTTVLLQQHSSPSTDEPGCATVPLPPDGGAVGMVLRTGYGTTQGGLMRKILFATERVNVYSMETVYFILLLVLIAAVASGVVLYYSLGDPTRDRYKLLLHCIMIVTSVVPPELPMELSLSVTNSLAALSHFFIFCTEPFRIPFAGRLSVLCFDKTGTLTKDKLVLKGIVAPPPMEHGPLDIGQPHDNFSFDNIVNNVPYALTGASSRNRASMGQGGGGGSTSIGRDDVEVGAFDSKTAVRQSDSAAQDLDDVPSQVAQESAPQARVYVPETCSDVTRAIMASCHSIMDLSTVGRGIVGDPMELVTLEASGFSVVDQNTVCGEQNTVRIRTLLRYPFSSTLKRMSVIAHCSAVATSASGGSASPSPAATAASLSCCFLFVKGAPEVLAPRIKHLPPHYQATYTYHMSRGRRVIALCYRPIQLSASGSKASSSSAAKSQSPSTSSSSSSSSAGVIASYSWRDISTAVPRESMESNLIFAGFAVYDCDLKPDTKAVIKELRQADHHIAIITGDSVHTAMDVGRHIGIIGKAAAAAAAATENGAVSRLGRHSSGETSSVAILHSVGDGGDACGLVWRGANNFISSDGADPALRRADDTPFSMDADALRRLSSSCKLCVTGASLDVLLNSVAVSSAVAASGSNRDSSGTASAVNAAKIAYLSRLCPHVTIFARVAPLQKELVVLSYNAAGHYTLMCGDGTNDVGALKAAHVGVSVINDADFETNVEESINSANAAGSSGTNSAAGSNTAAKRRLDRALVELQAQQQDSTVVKLGDASIASPFTARRTSIDVVLSLLKQGRCTLVTTIQVYKILALSCLATAFTMSFLYLNGLKQGDTQMTLMGLTMAGLFFVISQAKPMPRLSAHKPPSSVFKASVIGSIVGQCAVHMGCLYVTSVLCKSYTLVQSADTAAAAAAAAAAATAGAASVGGGPLAVDAEDFSPNVINTAIFLVTATIQVNNFAINYHGHPFMQSLTENVLLYRAVVGMYVVLLVLVGGQVEPLNDLFELVNFAHLRRVGADTAIGAGGEEMALLASGTVAAEFQGCLLGIMFTTAALGYGIETLCRRLDETARAKEAQ